MEDLGASWGGKRWVALFGPECLLNLPLERGNASTRTCQPQSTEWTSCARFPRYNDEQTLDALDYIVDGLESACAGGYTEEQWQSIAENFGEHVQNGLT
jgi:hypothetical protein